jgi:hypothetical protein
MLIFIFMGGRTYTPFIFSNTPLTKIKKSSIFTPTTGFSANGRNEPVAESSFQ